MIITDETVAAFLESRAIQKSGNRLLDLQKAIEIAYHDYFGEEIALNSATLLINQNADTSFNKEEFSRNYKAFAE